jgi:hypothetical protein
MRFFRTPAAPPTAPIRIDAETARKLELLAQSHGMTVAELVRPHLGPWTDTLFEQATGRGTVSNAGEPPPKSGPDRA